VELYLSLLRFGSRERPDQNIEHAAKLQCRLGDRRGDAGGGSGGVRSNSPSASCSCQCWWWSAPPATYTAKARTQSSPVPQQTFSRTQAYSFYAGQGVISLTIAHYSSAD